MEYPKFSYIQTETYLKGEIVTSDFFKNNPELFKNHPTEKEVINVISKIRNSQKQGVNYLIKISETGIEIIES